MAIDVETRRSPGWYMKLLFNMLGDRKRKTRLRLLADYLAGNPPLPQGAENARAAYEAFSRMARANFADLIVSALADRMQPVGFGTLGDDDETGDAEMGALWRRAGMQVSAGDVHQYMLGLREGYVIVGEVDEETDAPVVTAENPQSMIGLPDQANPQRLRAALKVKHDPEEDVDRAYLYLPGTAFGPGQAGQILVARRAAAGRMGTVTAFDNRSWEWDEERSGVLAHPYLPVVRFLNKNGVGEFEPHLDVLDRIMHQTLQRMTIAVMQAFRQRWVEGLPTHYPEDYHIESLRGREIDWSDVFTADPAAMWQLPPGATINESQSVDLRGLIEAIKSDITELAAASQTPYHMLLPAGDNQSAEGAQSQRDGLVNRAIDRTERAGVGHARVMALMRVQMGDTDTRQMAQIRTIWAPVDRLSLSERADAYSKVTDLPMRTKLIQILRFSPEEADRAMAERAAEQLDAQVRDTIAQAQAREQRPQPVAGQPPPPPPPPPPQPQPGNQPPLPAPVPVPAAG